MCQEICAIPAITCNILDSLRFLELRGQFMLIALFVKLHTQIKEGGKIPVALGIGATAARHALDVEIGVRIPDPQHTKQPLDRMYCSSTDCQRRFYLWNST